MNFDDGDGPSGGAAPKPPRFVPKSKFQPKARPKPGARPPVASVKPKKELSNDVAPPIPVKKEQDSDQPIQALEIEPSQNGAKTEIADGVELMDVDTNTVVTGEEPPNPEQEDFVVREIDVYFHPPPPRDDGTQLFVLQYPLRPAWRPYEFDEDTKIRVKRSTTDVEIDLSVDVDSQNFDKDAPSAKRFDKLTLSSKWRPYVQRTAYAIGVFTGSELHLNPVYAVRQLRPSMDYIYPSESKKKNVSEAATKATSSKAESSRNPNKAMDQKDDEPFIPLNFNDSSSRLSAEYRQNMSATEKSSPLTFPMKPIDYLDSLCPQAVIDKMKPVAQSKRSLLLLPLDQRLRLLFTEGPPIHKFSALKHYAFDHPEEDLLRGVEQFAVLVQGHWVAKTSIRCTNKSPQFCLARDYVLSLFSQSTTVKSSDLEAIRAHKLEPKDVLKDIAIERPKCNDWKFREPTDLMFLKQYPDIVEQFEQKWKTIGESLREKVRSKKNSMRANAFSKPNPALVSNQGAIKSASGPGIQRGTMSYEAREALPIALRKLFQARKVCSFQTICHGLRSMAVNISALPKADASVVKAAAFALNAPQEELLSVISEVVVNIHGAFVLKLSSEHPDLNPLRNVVIGLFIGKGPNAKVKKSEIIEAAKMQLQREPSNDELRKVVGEFCESSGSAWILKKGDGPPDNFSGK